MQIVSLLLLLILTASCKGKDKAGLTKDHPGGPELALPPGTDPHISFRCSMQDRAGNLWFGTTGAGIYRYDGRSFLNFGEKDGLANTTVNSILEDHVGNIWVGTRDGVFRGRG